MKPMHVFKSIVTGALAFSMLSLSKPNAPRSDHLINWYDGISGWKAGVASLAETLPRQHVSISVTPAMHVSEAFSGMAHSENLAAGDPVHPGRLITCSHAQGTDVNYKLEDHCYASFDDGRTWHLSLRVSEGAINGDPAVAFGTGDDVYATSLVTGNDDGSEATVVFKSVDGGGNFKEISRFSLIDRETIAVDRSASSHRGRVYIAGQGTVPEINPASLYGVERTFAVGLWRSADGGKTFQGPVWDAFPQGSSMTGVGGSAVLSNGFYVVLFGLTKPGQLRDVSDLQQPVNGELRVLTSRDGGQTFDASVKVADIVTDRSRSSDGIVPQLAIDPGSTYFKDRLYAVFPTIAEGRIQIESAYSTDLGKNWSKPVIVNDDRSPAAATIGPDHILPSVAANKYGAVLVTWYDRRDASDNLGWQLRGAVSLDGGETFSSSVPLTSNRDTAMPWYVNGPSETLGDPLSVKFFVNDFLLSGLDTSGLAVDSDGRFFPTWIDNHDGVPQLWSTSVRVPRTAIKHGSPRLAPLTDVSKWVMLECAKPIYDQRTGTLTIRTQLKNTSVRRIRGPIFVRVLAVSSQLARPIVQNADNGEHGTGAVWDFSKSLVAGKLDTLGRSRMKELLFNLQGVRPLKQGRDFERTVLSLEARVYGSLGETK